MKLGLKAQGSSSQLLFDTSETASISQSLWLSISIPEMLGLWTQRLSYFTGLGLSWSLSGWVHHHYRKWSLQHRSLTTAASSQFSWPHSAAYRRGEHQLSRSFAVTGNGVITGMDGLCSQKPSVIGFVPCLTMATFVLRIICNLP